MNEHNWLLLIGLPVAGWIVKEVADIRPLKEKVDHIVTRVDTLYEVLIEQKTGRPE